MSLVSGLSFVLEPHSTTLTKFLSVEESKQYPATGELTEILRAIQSATRDISALVRRTGQSLKFSSRESRTKEPKSYQSMSHDLFVNTLSENTSVGILLSDESKGVIDLEKEKKGKYIVTFTGLDSATNADCGISIGSIFAIWMKKDRKPVSAEDVTLPDNQIVAAGYVLYGSATTLLLSTGHGVNEFVLDSKIGEFLLNERNIKVPKRGTIYSINEGDADSWEEPIKEYVRQKKSQAKEKAYILRYVGSLVADVHRTIKSGGIFMYPASKKTPRGKFKLLCACHPIGYIVTQAGGMVSNGTMAILDVKPQKVHERSPMFLGSKEDVQELLNVINKYRSN